MSLGVYDTDIGTICRARLQSKPARQSGRHRARVERTAGTTAFRGAGCRRRFRCQELPLPRAGSDPLGREALRPAGEMDRQPDRGVHQRSSGARSSRGRIVGAGRRRTVSWPARRKHREHRRLYVRWRGLAAGLPVSASARWHLCHSSCRSAHSHRPDQYDAGRRHSRAGIRRSDQCDRAVDRHSGPPMRLRSRDIAASEYGAARR